MQSYLFESRPNAVAAGRKKFREPEKKKTRPIHDPRIVRGNTYAPGNIFVDRANASVVQAQEKAEAMRRRQALRRQREAEARQRELNAEPQLPPGRVSIPIQTDAYLDELEDQSFSSEMGVQTDPDTTRRVAPKFKKKKMGISVGTSVLPGELFDFDLSIEPILEVLIGKCLDQGSGEVVQEQELKSLKATEVEYRKRHESEEAEAKRLSDDTQRRHEQSEKLLKAHRQLHASCHKLAVKTASRKIAHAFLAGLQNTVLGKLEAADYLSEPASSQVRLVFLPWLVQEVDTRLKNITESRKLLDSMLLQSIKSGMEETSHIQAEEQKTVQDELDRIQAVKEERERIMQLLEDARNAPPPVESTVEESGEKDESGEGDDDESGSNDDATGSSAS